MDPVLRFLLLAGRLLDSVNDANTNSHAVIEVEVRDSQIEGGRELVATGSELFASSEHIDVKSWCPVNNGFALLVNGEKHELRYYQFV